MPARPLPRRRSKTVATWLAVLGGALGAHRFYLHGRRDVWGWLHLPAALAGLAGAVRLYTLGPDAPMGALLLPLLGLVLSQAMLAALLIALTPDVAWAQRWQQPEQPTGWGPVLGAICALMLGGTALMSTLAFGGQRLAEWLLGGTP